MFQPPQPHPFSKPTSPIGKVITLVPFHVTKIVYRQGEGSIAKQGQCINCYYNCYLIDGKQLLKKKSQTNIRKIIVGSGRLIEGLEIVMRTVRAGEKFTAVVSWEYGYKGVDAGLVSGLQGEKLLFDFQVVAVEQLFAWQKSQIQVLVCFKKMFVAVDRLVAQQKYKKALDITDQAISQFYCLRAYKSYIFIPIILKKSLILCHMNKHEEALELCSRVHQFDPQNIQLLLMLAKLSHIMNKNDKANKYYSRCLDLSKGNNEIRQIYIDFLRKTHNQVVLRELLGNIYGNYARFYGQFDEE